MSSTKPKTDDDKLIGIDEALETFGVTRNEVLEAIHTGKLAASHRPGPTGYRMRFADVRKYARSVHEESRVKPKGEQP